MTKNNQTRPLGALWSGAQLRYACKLVLAVALAAWLPVPFLVRGVNLLAALGRAGLCAMLKVCFALLMLAIIANVTFGLVRTLLHPWFVS